MRETSGAGRQDQFDIGIEDYANRVFNSISFPIVSSTRGRFRALSLLGRSFDVFGCRFNPAVVD
jgi:hypothetical protein